MSFTYIFVFILSENKLWNYCQNVVLIDWEDVDKYHEWLCLLVSPVLKMSDEQIGVILVSVEHDYESF